MGAPTYVNGILPGTNTGPNTTLNWAQTVGNTIIIYFGLHGISSNPAPTVTDTVGNSYTVYAPTAAQDLGFANGCFVAIATGIKAAAANANTVDISFNETVNDWVGAFFEYTTSTLDGTPVGNLVTGTHPVVDYTTVYANATVIETATNGDTYTAASSPWTDRADADMLTIFGSDIADQAIATAGSVVPTEFNAGSSSDRNCIIVFALAPPAATGIPVPYWAA
jgi:hypothetical protein